MVNILARILDSERNFNGSADPMITADRGFIQILRPDCGFWLLGSSDRGSQRSPGNLTFSFLCAGCPAVEKMTTNSNALKRDGSVMADSDHDLVDFLRGSTDSAINFSRSADLHTPIHPPPNHTANDMILIPIEKIFSNRYSIRKAREAFLIQKGRTIDPDGLNIREETY